MWSNLWSNLWSTPDSSNCYSAFFRHTAGYCWAYNTRNFFQFYYPHFDIGTWTFCASVFGGSFGVFAGGFFSDRLVKYLGLPSRLWLLAICTILASPFAVGTLYFPPPGAFGKISANLSSSSLLTPRLSDPLLLPGRDLVRCPLHCHRGDRGARGRQ